MYKLVLVHHKVKRPEAFCKTTSIKCRRVSVSGCGVGWEDDKAALFITCRGESLS